MTLVYDPSPTDTPMVRVRKKVMFDLGRYYNLLQDDREAQEALTELMSRIDDPTSIRAAGVALAESLRDELLSLSEIPEQDIPGSIRTAANRAGKAVLTALPHTTPPHVADFVRSLCSVLGSCSK